MKSLNGSTAYLFIQIEKANFIAEWFYSVFVHSDRKSKFYVSSADCLTVLSQCLFISTLEMYMFGAK